MGIKKLKLPTNILQPEEDLGLSGLMRLGRTVTEEGEDLSFLNEKSALMSIQQDDVFDVEALVNESIRSIALVPKDLKYDDSSMPTAPNFLEWCEGREFLNAKPYLEQALAGILLFAEFCPDDSDMDWVKDINQHDPLLGTQSIRDHMTLTNFGVCPKCGKTRLDHFESGALNFYNELVLLWGQRCVTGDTHVLTSNGIERIGAIGRNKPFGFSTYNQPVYNGKEFETTSDFYRGKAERVYALKLRNGYVLRGTGDHPVMTYNNFKRLSNITGKDLVPVYLGQNVWGNKQIYHYDLADAAKASLLIKKATTSNPHLVKSAAFKSTNTIMCADFYKVLGYWVAEGRGSFISNTDPDVLDFCYITLTKYINARYVDRQYNGIYLKGHTALAYLAAALGLDNGSTYSGSAAKVIPDSVLQSTKENVCSFMSGLFEGDGTVDTGTGRIKGRVSITTISRSLAYDVYAVLTNLGILPRIRQRKTWATNGTAKQISKNSWEVSFAGTKFLSIFQENIGFASTRKSDRLSKIILRTTSGNDVPYSFDNYSFLKGELTSLLSTIRSELCEFALPYTEFAKPASNRKSKSARTMTLHTILKDFSGHFGFKIHKMLGGSKALTRTRLRYITDALLRYSNYMSAVTVSRLGRMKDLVAENVYLLEVKDCILTDNVCETYDFTLPDTHQFITQGILSHNSGKSEVTAMLTSYQTHRVLKMQNPTKIYGIGSNQILQGTFVALTQSQAMENLWTPYYGYLTGSPWFKKYHELMAYYDAKYGLEMVKVRDTFVLYKHRSLLVYPASPDLRVLRGRTRLWGAMDELGWMDNNAATASKKVKANATGTYQALSNSLQTVRAEEQRLIAAGVVDCISGYMYNISSPSSIRDKICELYRLSQGSKKMLGIQAPTWKINPKFSRATLDEDFRKDPIAAERDFGANPPLSSAPFINDFSIITDAMKEKGKNFVNYKHQVFVAHDLEKTKTRYASILGCKESTVNSVLALDAGETNNSFAMSVMSKQGGIISIDCLIDIMPLPGIPLNYTLIYNEIILPVCKMRNVKIVVSDRWNSTKILQDLYDTLVIAKYQKYSLKYEDMWNFKSRLEQRSVQIPRSALLNSAEDLRGFDVSEYPRCFENRPVEHFMFQCVTVQDSGRQVIKGPDMTDDLWRATVLGCWALENPDFSYYLKEEIKSQQSRDPRRLAVSRAGSGYSSGAGMEGGSKVGRVGAVRRKRGGFDS